MSEPNSTADGEIDPMARLQALELAVQVLFSLVAEKDPAIGERMKPIIKALLANPDVVPIAAGRDFPWFLGTRRQLASLLEGVDQEFDAGFVGPHL